MGEFEQPLDHLLTRPIDEETFKVLMQLMDSSEKNNLPKNFEKNTSKVVMSCYPRIVEYCVILLHVV